MNELRVRLRTRLESFALDVDFRAPGRGITALFGPSGAGKTSVLRCVAGLQRAADAELHVNDECWQDEARGHFLPTHRRAIGYAFQEANLFPHLSVRGNLDYGFRRVPVAERRVSFEQATELLGVTALLDRDPATLSGGERQRAAIARALLTSPRLLLLDEPLSALDEPSRAEILPYLDRLHRELSVPVLYVSHAIDEVARIADYMILMESGRVRAQGPLAELLTRLDLSLAQADSASTIVEATVAEHDEAFHLTYFDFDGGRIVAARTPAARGESRRIRIQARDVSLALAAPQPQQSSILNVLPVTVQEIVEDRPGRVVVRLAAGGAVLLARITRKSATLLDLAPGKPVYAQIKGVAVLD